MVHIPAFCDSCGAVFGSGIVVENCVNVSLSGNRSGPCPRCGGMGSVIDGLFNVTENVIEILSAPERTRTQLKALTGILQSAANGSAPLGDIAAQIKETVPELSEVARFLPKTSTELVAWLTLILLAIQTISDIGEEEKPSTTVILNQVIEQSMQQHNYYPSVKPPSPKRQGRNSFCDCGSGVKYKRCCGKSI